MLLDKPFGLAGERKACALVCLSFYASFFGLLALLLNNAPPDQPEVRAWWPCFAALGGCYGLAFFSLGAGWFWARWFAIGLGYSGVTLAGWTIFTQKSIDPVIAFYGLTHGIIALFLQGQKLVEEYDSKPAWRQALGLDEKSVLRVRHSVTRAAASLPTLILMALAPRQGSEGLLIASLAVIGLFGVLRLRTFGVLALLGAGVLVPWSVFTHSYQALAVSPMLSASLVQLMGLSATALLIAAAAPFLGPVVRFLRSPAKID
jgi:hypothetical protein